MTKEEVSNLKFNDVVVFGNKIEKKVKYPANKTSNAVCFFEGGYPSIDDPIWNIAKLKNSLLPKKIGKWSSLGYFSLYNLNDNGYYDPEFINGIPWSGFTPSNLLFALRNAVNDLESAGVE